MFEQKAPNRSPGVAMKYDFDIQLIVPKGMFEDPKLDALLGGGGLNPNTSDNYVALFRDQKTVDALNGASPVVREFFKASGFGFSTHDSGAPDGFYPQENETAYLDVLRRVSENMKVFNLKNEDTNGFFFPDFLAHIVAAKPVDMHPKTPDQAPQALAAAAVPANFEDSLAEKAEAHASSPALTMLKRAVVALTIYIVLWQGASFLGLIGPIALDEGNPGSTHAVARSGE